VIVLDASAALDGLLDPVGHADIAVWLSGSAEPLAAPDLIDVEVMSVLSAHDADYVALAQVLPAKLLTTDDRMAHAAADARVAVVPA
jgi:predicted nucleic acid-binding protein